jgi:hypothetical protein
MLDDDRKLVVVTKKSHDGYLTTSAMVGKVSGAFFTSLMFRDFNCTLEKNKVRVTSKAISEQHYRCLDNKEQIISLAREHYKAMKA